MAARHREGNGSKRPGGGDASRPPGPTAGSHRQRPLPAQGRSRGTTRGRRTGAPNPHGGLAPTATATPRAAAGPGRTLSRRIPAPPPQPSHPHTRGAKAPHTLAPGTEGTAPPGDTTGRQRPGGDTHVRRGRFGSTQGKGTRAVARAGRGEERGRPAAAGRGQQARTARAVGQGRGHRPGNHGNNRKKTPGTRPGPQENQRGIPPPPTHGGGPATPGTPAGPGHPRSGPHDPAPPPGPASQPSTHLPPSILDRSVFHLRLTPRLDILGTTLSSEAAQTVTARRHRLRLRGEGGRDRLLLTTSGGAGEAPGPTGRHAPPHFPLPPGLTPRGAGRAQTGGRPPHLPDARRGPAGPSPDSEGGGAGRGRQRAAHGPTAGAGAPKLPPLPRGGGWEGVLPTCSGSRHGGHCALGRGSGWGVRYPKAPSSRIAREGILPEGTPPLTRTVFLLRAHGGALHEPPVLSWAGGGLRYREANHHTGACARSGPEQKPASRPP